MNSSKNPSTRLRSFPHPVNVLVVGASGGIGLGFVRTLLSLENVAHVFASCRRPASGSSLDGLDNADPDRLHTLMLDVTDDASIAAAAAKTAGVIRQLDLLINCAGILHNDQGLKPERRLADLERANLVRSFEINALGPAFLARHFGPLFDRKSRAVFASLSARVGSISDNRLGGWYGYRASKAAHNMMVKNLSIELRRRARGIICVALHPGTVDTALSRPFQDNVPPEKLFTTDRAARHLLTVIDGLGADDNGCFYDWNNQEVPW